MIEEAQEVGTHQEIKVPINYKYNRDYQTHYSNQVIIQGGEHEIIISFFSMLLEVERPDGTRQSLEELKRVGVDAECVARIVVSKTFFPQLVEAFNNNLNSSFKVPSKERLQEILSQMFDDTAENK